MPSYQERREYMRKYQREWIAKRRSDWFSDKSCVDCGSKTELEIDHVNPADKVTNIVWSWSPERRDVELAKCVVRCFPCHKIKTILNRDKPHGEGHYNAKRSDVVVANIRAEYANGYKQATIARKYGISKQAVWEIVHRKTWAHLP